MRARILAQEVSVFIITVVLLIESCYGLIQVLGWRASRNALFLLTGHFDNPGPYGGFVAVLLSVTVSWCLIKLFANKPVLDGRKIKMVISYGVLFLAAIASFLGGVVLVASLSRTAWVGFMLAELVFILIEQNHLGFRYPNWQKHAPILCLIILVLSYTAFDAKRDSAIGRLHIWRIESRVIANNPLKGVGKGRCLGEYGLEQAAFFKEKERPAIIKRVAGCPEYAFNEYLKIGMEYGVIGLIVSLLIAGSVIYVLVRSKSPFAYGAIVYAVFAFGSYPLSLWQFQIMGTVFIVAAFVSLFHCRTLMYLIISLLGLVGNCVICFLLIVENERKHNQELVWESISRSANMELYEDAIPGYEELYISLKDNYYFLYDYGYALFKVGRFVEAQKILREGASLSSDPMFHIIIGRCQEALNDYETAESEYMLAHFMVPGRLYPLVLLKEMYDRQGDDVRAGWVLEKIMQIPVNPKNKTMQDLLLRVQGNEEGY